jgi:hypothetical protein
MIKKTVLLLTVLFLAGAVMPGRGSCAWELLRSSEDPLAVVYASTGGYSVAYTIGSACASPYNLAYSPYSAWSGYLSLIPSSMANKGYFGLEGGSGVMQDSALWGAPPDEGVNLLFSTDISTWMSRPSVNVTRVRDNSGAEVNENWAVATSYAGQKLVILPSADWPKGSVFAVYYSSSIVDINGEPVSGASTVYFTVQMDHLADNTATSVFDSRVRVVIPANAYSEDFFLALSTDSQRPAIVAANAKLAEQPGGAQFLDMVSVSPYGASGAALQPGSACLVTLPYPDADGDGRVDGRPWLKASNLAVWLRDEASNLWVKQTGASLSTSSRTVTLPVTHFSDYALLALPDADLSPVFAYPVPFRPNAGNPARYGTWAQGIRFTNLPGYGRIRIYTLSGDLVRELPVTAVTETWDVKNSAGALVASGVYLWEAAAGSGHKTGKLVVIK